MTKELWIAKGIVTDPSAYATSPQIAGRPPPDRGDPEWRVFDSDPTTPTGSISSADFLTLEAALQHASGAIVHLVDEPCEDLTLYDRWEAFVMQPGSICQRMDEVRDAAHEQGILGSLLDALDQHRV